MTSYSSKTVSKLSSTSAVVNGPYPPRNKDTKVWIRTSARRSSLARMSMANNVFPAYLIYFSENGAEQRFDITKSVLTIGRREDRDIVLQCQLISKDHASIEKDEHGFLIVDHQSANGILLNDEPIQLAAYLRDGDEIQIGSILLKFFDEVEITKDSNWEAMKNNHPALALSIHSDESSLFSETAPEFIEREFARTIAGSTPARDIARRNNNKISNAADRAISDKHLSLVAILQPEKKYEDSMTVRAEIDGTVDNDDFMPASSIEDTDTLRNDYEKLRLAYELSKMGITEINSLLEKTLDLMFSVLPVDRGVVLLVDGKTGMLTTDKVKLRQGKGVENKEILLSYTILEKVFTTKRCLIISDVLEDPLFGKAESIARGSIRSVICVPLVSRNEVHGILHLDSQDRINAFSEKDLALVKAISNQTAIALENCKLVKDVEKEVTIRENLGRFLPPHVVEKVISKGEEPVKKGGRQTTGTILFADIRGFTNLSERSSPQEIVDMLNDFFERLVKIVFKYDGVLDKYIGDCLMAAFGTLPDQEPEAELKAICAAIEFKDAIREINEERIKAGKEPITIGVGLNTGNLVSGYIGSSQRLEYTNIGDTVNTASRICSMATENQVLVSEFTYRIIEPSVEARFVGKKIFKGKSSEVAVYEILSCTTMPSKIQIQEETDELEAAVEALYLE